MVRLLPQNLSWQLISCMCHLCVADALDWIWCCFLGPWQKCPPASLFGHLWFESRSEQQRSSVVEALCPASASKDNSLWKFRGCPEALQQPRVFAAFSFSPALPAVSAQALTAHPLCYSASPKINPGLLLPTLICCLSTPCTLVWKLLLKFSSGFFQNLEDKFCNFFLEVTALICFCLALPKIVGCHK